MLSLRSSCFWSLTWGALQAIVLSCSCNLAFVAGQGISSSRAPNDYTPELLQRQFLREAESYEIQVEKDGRKLTLKKEPLLNWQNPERPSTLGSLFVWFDGTRPAVLASVFTFQVSQELRRKHEMLSLLPEAMVAAMDGERVWTPGSCDLAGVDIEISQRPHASEAGRLTQMRAIAREFRGMHQDRDNGQSQELRLMSQPILRYQSEPDKILDGALFAMAVGTDPEILLMIEVRQTNNGAVWKVVPFRSHFDELELVHQEKVVWKVPLKLPLMTTRPMAMPFAKDPFFVFYPTNPIPSVDSLKELDKRAK